MPEENQKRGRQKKERQGTSNHPDNGREAGAGRGVIGSILFRTGAVLYDSRTAFLQEAILRDRDVFLRAAAALCGSGDASPNCRFFNSGVFPPPAALLPESRVPVWLLLAAPVVAASGVACGRNQGGRRGGNGGGGTGGAAARGCPERWRRQGCNRRSPWDRTNRKAALV